MTKRRSIVGKDILRMGIDLSLTSTGYCIANKDFDRVATGVLKTDPKENLDDRILYIYSNLKALIEGNPKPIVELALEGLAFASRGQRLTQLAGLHYYVVIEFRRHLNIPLTIVSPTQLKRFVTGKGNCKKNVMLMKCFKRWNFETNDDNICDAYCLARYCWEVKNEGERK